MDDRYGIENPLGFQVTGYRVDNDYSTASPRQPLSSSMGVDAAVPVHEAAQQEEAAPPVPEYGDDVPADDAQNSRSNGAARSEENTSELQSLMRSSYAVDCLKKKKKTKTEK